MPCLPPLGTIISYTPMAFSCLWPHMCKASQKGGVNGQILQILTLRWDDIEMISTLVLRIPKGTEPQSFAAITCSLTYPVPSSFPSLSQLLTPLLVLPGITARDCFQGTQLGTLHLHHSVGLTYLYLSCLLDMSNLGEETGLLHLFILSVLHSA